MTSTWTDLIDDLTDPGDQFTADEILNAIYYDLDFLRNPPVGSYALSTGGANVTTTSTTFTDLGLFTVTLTTQGNPVDIFFDARVNTSTVARFDFVVDGVSITGDNDGLGANSPISTFGQVSIHRKVALTAGSHTVKVQWRSTSGATLTLYAAGLGQLNVREAA